MDSRPALGLDQLAISVDLRGQAPNSISRLARLHQQLDLLRRPGLIFFPFFFLGLLLFHSLISLPSHFFEVIGFLITRFPW
jgi:hypothetical protein